MFRPTGFTGKKFNPMGKLQAPIKGRGALSNRASRFNATSREPFEDDPQDPVEAPSPRTTVTGETPRSMITRNRSPDIPFDQSINPYRGCEHGCVYCYARPSHAYLGLSPGLDFETRLFVKRDAAGLLRKELGRRNYVCTPIALGTNTDPYQPVERRHRVMRELLTVLEACRHPVTITTKSALIERDLDLLGAMAPRNLVRVQISLTTLDPALARLMEPRATAPARRLDTVARLSEAGIPTAVMIAPVIPFINDAELETLLAAAAKAGADGAGYIILRLPLEIAELFREWLEAHFPLQAKRVLHCIEDIHGGKIYDPRFGIRHRGTGVFAELLQRRFRIALQRQGLDRPEVPLDVRQFRPPEEPGSQMDLFDGPR